MTTNSAQRRNKAADLKSPSGDDSQPLATSVRRGAFWSLLSTLLLRLSSVLITAVVAHILDRHDFGVFTIAFTIYGIVIAVGELGLGSCLIRADLDLDSIAPTMTTVSVVTNVVQAGVMVVFAKPIATALGSPAAADPVRVLALLMAIAGVFTVPSCQLVRDFKQNKLFLAQVVGFVPSTIVLLLLAASGSGAMAFAWSMVVGQFVSGCVIVASVSKIYRPGFARSALSILLKFGLPLGAANIVNYILLNADYALIGHLIGAIALGSYVLAFNVASWPASILGNVINNVSMPAFSRIKDDADRLKSAVFSGLRALSLAVLPISALTIALARPLILTLYGAKWSASAEVLSVLAIYGAISIVCVFFANILAGLGLSKFLLFVQVIWLLALLPAMVAGIETNGIMGAAVAHIAVVGPIVLPCYLFVLNRMTRVRFLMLAKAILPPLLASSAAAVAARGTASLFTNSFAQLATGLAVGGLVYLIAVAPQAVGFLSQRGATSPYVERILRVYDTAARFLGLPVGRRPRHSNKRSGQLGPRGLQHTGVPTGATPGLARIVAAPSADVANSAAAAIELLISFSTPQPIRRASPQRLASPRSLWVTTRQE